MKTATFKDYERYEIKAATAKRSAKYGYRPIEVIEEIHPVNVSFRGKSYLFYLRNRDVIEYNKTQRSNMIAELYHEDGAAVKAAWRHGWTGGKMHTERLEIWMDGRRLIEVCNYQNGRVKDSKKYLIQIL
jgi:hypothetical protein